MKYLKELKNHLKKNLTKITATSLLLFVFFMCTNEDALATDRKDKNIEFNIDEEEFILAIFDENKAETSSKIRVNDRGLYDLYWDLIVRYHRIDTGFLRDTFKLHYTLDGSIPTKDSPYVELENGYYAIKVRYIAAGEDVNLKAIGINAENKKTNMLYYNFNIGNDPILVQDVKEQNDAIIRGDRNSGIRDYIVETCPYEKKALASAIIDEIIDPNMSDLEKVDAIYRWIKSNTIYSSNYAYLVINTYEEILKREHVSSAMRVFNADDEVVCSGVAEAFTILSRTAGLKAYSMYGMKGEIKHMWNIVIIDDNPYHIDIGFDNFLLSDIELLIQDYSWAYGPIFLLGKEYYVPRIKAPISFNDFMNLRRSQLDAEGMFNFMRFRSSAIPKADEIDDTIYGDFRILPEDVKVFDETHCNNKLIKRLVLKPNNEDENI